MCKNPSPHIRCAPAADAGFGRGLGPVLGLGKLRCARLRLLGAMACPKCSTMRSETAPGAQSDPQSSLLGCLAATF